MGNKNQQQTGIIKPTLYFTPYAWAKVIYLANKGPTEVGAYGISTRDDPLVITDVRMVKQVCSSAFVKFDRDSIGEFADQMIDEGRIPAEFGRIWIHTHPGQSPHPSGTDEQTFSETFGKCSWSVMGILCRDGTYYARLQFKSPRASVEMKVEIDYQASFGASNHNNWDTEYTLNFEDSSSQCTAHSYYGVEHHIGFGLGDEHFPARGVCNLSKRDDSRRSNYDYFEERAKSFKQPTQADESTTRSFLLNGVWQSRNNKKIVSSNDHLVRVANPVEPVVVEKNTISAIDDISIEVDDSMIFTDEDKDIQVLEDPTSDTYKEMILSQLRDKNGEHYD